MGREAEEEGSSLFGPRTGHELLETERIIAGGPVSMGEEESEESVASHKGWKSVQEGLGRWAGGWGACGGQGERNH